MGGAVFGFLLPGTVSPGRQEQYLEGQLNSTASERPRHDATSPILEVLEHLMVLTRRDAYEDVFDCRREIRDCYRPINSLAASCHSSPVGMELLPFRMPQVAVCLFMSVQNFASAKPSLLLFKPESVLV
jgi:hypothetical protein